MGILGKFCIVLDVMECFFGMDRCMIIDGEIVIFGGGFLEFIVKNCLNNVFICVLDGLVNSE